MGFTIVNNTPLRSYFILQFINLDVDELDLLSIGDVSNILRIKSETKGRNEWLIYLLNYFSPKL